MTGTKIVVIVLVLIAVLFVVLVVWGAGNNHVSPKTTAANINQQPMPSVVGRLEQMFGSQGPRLDAAHMHPALTTFDLQKQGSYKIEVLPDDNPVRQAEFRVTVGSACAHLSFKPAQHSPDGFDNQEAHPRDPNSKGPDRNPVTLNFPKEGGTITVARESALSSAPCTVTLK